MEKRYSSIVAHGHTAYLKHGCLTTSSSPRRTDAGLISQAIWPEIQEISRHIAPMMRHNLQTFVYPDGRINSWDLPIAF